MPYQQADPVNPADFAAESGLYLLQVGFTNNPSPMSLSIYIFYFNCFLCPFIKMSWAELLEACLVLTSIKYHDNLLILVLLNQWLVLTMLQTTGPCMIAF